MRLKKMFAGALFIVLATMLTACGPSAAEVKAQKVKELCNQANSAMSKVTLDQIVPPVGTNWNTIQKFYADLNTKLKDLSTQASNAGDDQLARDFASVGKGASSLEAVASLISMVGYGTTTSSEWLSKVNAFTGNDALRAKNDRTFIACHS